MAHLLHRCLILIACLVIAGCNAPRGAGFQSEVLAASKAKTGEIDGEPQYDFSVFSVTRTTLQMLQSWPEIGVKKFNWINRVKQPASLLIAPGDVLTVAVWEVEENPILAGTGQKTAILQDVTVSSTGDIFIPFIGNMRVTGMSPQTARNRVEEKLLETIPSAQVQLTVVPGRANTANVVSGAAIPGIYPLPDRNFTLLDLLSTAGGVNPALINPQVRLFRGNRTYGISLGRIFDNPQLDTTLVGGDRVIIEGEERYFLSLGATGIEALHTFPKEDVSALDALSIVGGVADARANPQGILILREYSDDAVRVDTSGPPQNRIVFTLDLTSADGLFSAGKFAIQPNDLVYATESPLNTALTLFGALQSTASVLRN